MNNPNNGGGMFGFRQPAQRETLTGGLSGEFHIPIIQAFASIVFACLTVLFTWILIFIIGPDVLWIAGFVVIVAVSRRVLLWIGTAQQTTQEEINGARAMTIGTCAIALVMLGAWAVSRPFCVSIWPIMPPTYNPWRVIFAVSFIVVFIVIFAVMAAHFLMEAYNPAVFQPHMAKPAGTPWWSPTGISIDETEPFDDEYMPAQIVRSIPRPIPAYDVNHPNPNNGHLQAILTDASERQHRTPPEHSGLPVGAFKAPNGRIARIEDLAEFLIEGVTVGATYKTWHTRRGWGEEYWQAMIGTCAQHGFAKPSRIKSRSKLLVTTKKEAADALAHLNCYLFRDKLPPSPAPETIEGEIVPPSGR